MTSEELMLIKGALAALSQNKTYQADIDYAKRCLRDALVFKGCRDCKYANANMTCQRLPGVLGLWFAPQVLEHFSCNQFEANQ